MSFSIKGIQIGSVLSEGIADTKDPMQRHWTTGFYKKPVAGDVRLTRLGIEGDQVADTRHHGGADKAILCYAASHYDLWPQEYPDLAFAPGAFAENLTVSSTDEANICIGDVYRIGETEIEISQPRQPCWKISRRWGVKTLTKAVTQTGRTGWYARVLREGMLRVGASAERLSRPHPDWTVKRANDVMFGREVDRLAVIELMNLDELAEAWKRDIA